MFQTFGTSELGGKLLAEGKAIEADLVTMSSYYIDSAQSQNKMFLELTFDHLTIQAYPLYYTPITAQEGTIIVNTELLALEGLPMPEGIGDLADPAFTHVAIVSSETTSGILNDGR